MPLIPMPPSDNYPQERHDMERMDETDLSRAILATSPRAKRSARARLMARVPADYEARVAEICQLACVPKMLRGQAEVRLRRRMEDSEWHAAQRRQD